MKAPKAPDPVKTAATQTAQNINTATANSIIGNANEIGPTGSVTYRQIGQTDVGGQMVPQFERRVQLSPQEQRLYDQQNQLGYDMNALAGNQVKRLDNVLGSPMDLDGLPDVPQYDREAFTEALYSRLSPQIDRDRAALETRLANQGIRSGSEAYREAIAGQDRAATDARMQALLNSGQYAGQELSMAQAERNRALQERLAIRNQPLNEISALMSGGQVNMPQFQGYQGGQVAGTDIAGMIERDYQRKASEHQAKLGGLASIGGSLLMAPMTGGGSLGGSLVGGLFGGLGGAGKMTSYKG